jgi:hypothetical protein
VHPAFRSLLLTSCVAIVAPFVAPSAAVASSPERVAGLGAVSAPTGVPIMIPQVSTPTIVVPQDGAAPIEFGAVDHPSLQLIGDGFEYAAVTEYFSHPDADGVRTSSIYVEALTSATDIASPAITLAAGGGTAPAVVGQVDGVNVYLSPSEQPNAPAEIQWLPEPHTQVTVGAVGSDAVPVSTLLNIAAGLQLVPSGQTMPASSPDSVTGSGLQPPVDPQPKATCTSTCPTSSNMRGTDSVTDDWDVNATICNTCTINSGNMVGVWQAILWADGAPVYANQTSFSNCDVDGIFGARTSDATDWWQYMKIHLESGGGHDGIVGPQTWARADKNLKKDAGLVAYRGEHTTLYFSRSTSANAYYSWSWNDSPYYYTGYSGRQIVVETTACHPAP